MGHALAASPQPLLWRAPLVETTTGMVLRWSCALLVVLCAAGAAMCPPQCLCHDDTLSASCTSAKLEVFPIQLNPDVKHIDLSGNKISSVDYTLTFYIYLLRLDLSYNKIHSLGSHNFESQENLTFLNISFNQINRLGKGAFKGLKVLLELDLRNNSIESVDGSAFKDTLELEMLDLSNNKITSFEDPQVFKNLQKLKILYLDGNQIIDVPNGVLQNLPNPALEHLRLSNNYIDTLDDKSFPNPSMRSLTHLSLSSNVISNIHRSSFNSLHSLTHLDLSDNNLTLVPTEQMSKLGQLTELNLSDNMFSEIPAVAFQSLFHLKVLGLSRMTRLDRIDFRAFVDNIHLDSLIMEDNKEVLSLPARVFHGNLHLRHISIRRNSLSTIDASHFPLDNLRSLDVSENPFHCNCSLLWLWKLALQEKKTSVTMSLYSNESSDSDDGQPLRISVSNLRCHSPHDLKGKLLTDVPESVVRCETTWTTVAAVTGFVVALFVTTCVVLLLISSDKPLLFCRKSKDPDDVPSDSTKRLAPGLNNGTGPPPVLMLMPEKDFHPDPLMVSYMKPSQVRDLRYMEPWVPVKTELGPAHNEYTIDITTNLRKPAHVVYV